LSGRQRRKIEVAAADSKQLLIGRIVETVLLENTVEQGGGAGCKRLHAMVGPRSSLMLRNFLRRPKEISTKVRLEVIFGKCQT
jgi:hypothetical protein